MSKFGNFDEILELKQKTSAVGENFWEILVLSWKRSENGHDEKMTIFGEKN